MATYPDYITQRYGGWIMVWWDERRQRWIEGAVQPTMRSALAGLREQHELEADAEWLDE